MSKQLNFVATVLALAGLHVEYTSSGRPGVRGHCGTPPRQRRGRQRFKAHPFIGKVKNIKGTIVFRPRHASSTLGVRHAALAA